MIEMKTIWHVRRNDVPKNVFLEKQGEFVEGFSGRISIFD
jgi:hypothetical protein